MQPMNEKENGKVFEDWMQEILWPSSSSEHDNLQQFHHHPQRAEQSASTSPRRDRVEYSAASTSPRTSCDSESQLWHAHDHLHNDLHAHSEQRTSNPIKEKKQLDSRIIQPKVALQTRSDTDILDDGYKWRKYGQKSVKNSKHPRSYFRCSATGCPVKKRVERSTLDPSLVVTTYHSMHNHHITNTHNMDPYRPPIPDNS